jgi:hypothetical protein
VYGIIYRYKYVTDFVNVGSKLLSMGTKETNSGLNTLDFSSERLPARVMTHLPSSFRRTALSPGLINIHSGQLSHCASSLMHLEKISFRRHTRFDVENFFGYDCTYCNDVVLLHDCVPSEKVICRQMT